MFFVQQNNNGTYPEKHLIINTNNYSMKPISIIARLKCNYVQMTGTTTKHLPACRYNMVSKYFTQEASHSRTITLPCQKKFTAHVQLDKCAGI